MPGVLNFSEMKSGALRVEGDVAYVRMLAAIERLKVVTARREAKFNPNHDELGHRLIKPHPKSDRSEFY